MNFKRYLNENKTALNWNNINRVRLQKNSRPGFSLGYGEALTCALARVDRLPLYDIYEPKSQKSRRIFKFLQFRTKRAIYRGSSRKFEKIRHLSTFFANGRRTPPPQSAPMGSRLASLLLSVRACGSSQGESRQKEHPGGSVSACARDLDISRPTARKWKPTEQAEPTKKRGKLSRILNILKE